MRADACQTTLNSPSLQLLAAARIPITQRLLSLAPEYCLFSHRPAYLNQPRDNARPPGLMTGSQPRAVVPVKIFKKENIVAPIGVILEPVSAAVHRAPTIYISHENAAQATNQLHCHFVQSHHIPRAGRTFDLEIVPVIRVEVKQG